MIENLAIQQTGTTSTRRRSLRHSWIVASARAPTKADEALSAVDAEMMQLAKAINASPVNSIEGLRAKALIAFYEVAPLSAGDPEFYFGDAYPFQQLFAAVAEVCGLEGKMMATGYELPDIAMVDDDSDDDEEEA
jgi:hypothetical protein